MESLKPHPTSVPLTIRHRGRVKTAELLHENTGENLTVEEAAISYITKNIEHRRKK